MLDRYTGLVRWLMFSRPATRRGFIAYTAVDAVLLLAIYVAMGAWVSGEQWWLAAPPAVHIACWAAPAVSELSCLALTGRGPAPIRAATAGVALAVLYAGPVRWVFGARWWLIAPLWMHVLWCTVPAACAMTIVLRPGIRWPPAAAAAPAKWPGQDLRRLSRSRRPGPDRQVGRADRGAQSGQTVKGDGNWCRAYALALYGKPVTFLGAYAAVTVVRNEDGSFTADITRPSGETDFRGYARRGEEFVVAAVAAECASIAAHGPDGPMCRTGEHSLCGHVAFATPPGPERRTR